MSKFDFKDVLFFDAMLTPKVITFVYWLGLIGIVLGGVGALFAGSIGAALGILIGGSIGLRIWCELVIVLFKINQNIQRVADKG